jgi:cysteine synthase
MRNPIDSGAFDAAHARCTPLLRVGRALAKLESQRPSGGVEDRLLGLWEIGPFRGEVLACGSAGAALAGAAWARARGVQLRQIVHGPLTHEARKALELWGLPFTHVATRFEALQRVAREHKPGGPTVLAELDGWAASLRAAGELGAELLADLDEAGAAPGALVAASGATAALCGCALVLQKRWPDLAVVALCAAPGEVELPELGGPLEAFSALPNFSARAVTRAEAAQARRELARSTGLLAGHASAAAIAVAGQLAAQLPAERWAVALCTSTGERELSLDAKEPA